MMKPTFLEFRKASMPEAFDLALQIRTEVFVQEQQVPEEEEWDGYDETATHWLMLDEVSGEAIATGRIVPHPEMPGFAKVGRVAVRQQYRGLGLGAQLMRHLLAQARQLGFEGAFLHAQTQARSFYERLGFIAEGPEFLEAGIPHCAMRLCFSVTPQTSAASR
jgi:predicted GNAT family N-acyltransferase